MKLLKNKKLIYGAGIMAAVVAIGWAVDHYFFWPARRKRTREIDFVRKTY